MSATGRKRVLAIVLAGGEGKRLMPLTADRAKPAVPFAGIYRLIDFALSNVVNSGYLRVVVLTQYKSHSLDRHVTTTWRMSTLLGNYVAPVPAQQRVGKNWYLGSADAIYQSLNLIHDDQPDIVVVVGADHVYRMDFAQMVDQHVQSGAACTVAAIRQPISLADQFGVIDVQPEDPRSIREFLEKPTAPEGLPDNPDEVLASMGNYVFDAQALAEAVTRDSDMQGSKHDMGGDIVPAFVRRQEAGVYDFKDNQVPGATDRDRGYWRDVGTMRSFFDAHMDVVSPLPVFNLYNGAWPIYTAYGPQPPAKLAKGADGSVPVAEEALLSPGAVVSGGQVRRSVLSPAVRVEQGAVVEDSVLMDGVLVGAGAVVRNTILDKAVRVPPGAQIGVDPEVDAQRGFMVEGGLTVLGKGQAFPDV
jgi:glucose-1-phosphate adenylyltransferase